MIGIKKLNRFFTFLIFGVMSQSLYAAAPSGRPPEKDLTVTVGVATLYSSTFQGFDDVSVSIVPDLQLHYRDDFFASIPEGVGWNIITRGAGESGWKIGPLAKIKFSRDEQDNNPFNVISPANRFRGMGNVPMAAEVGGFADYKYEKIQTRLELRRGFGGHDGVVASARINYGNRIGPLRVGFGPRITWTDSKYNNTYYGVDATQSLNTGLSEYNAGSGITSYGIGGIAIMPLNFSTVMTFFAGYDSLSGAAEKSPVIKRYDTKNEVVLGLGISYQFGFDL